MSKKPAKDKAKSATATKTIALNKRARHEYHLEERYEAGLALQGWEVKAIRAGRANIVDGYAYVRSGEIYLIGAQITPLIQASTHVIPVERRDRKLLLHRAEIDKVLTRVEREGYTGAHRAVLEQQQGQAGDRIGQGQAVARQARCRQGTRLAARQAARDAAT